MKTMQSFISNITKAISFVVFILLFESYSYAGLYCEPSNNTGRLHNVGTVISIHNQESFEKLPKMLKDALNFGYKIIEVRFHEGDYYFNNRHLALNNSNYPDANIRFIGNNTHFIPKGETVNVSQDVDPREIKLNYSYSYITTSGKDVNLWSPFYTTDSLIQVVNKNEKLCRLCLPQSFFLDDEVNYSHVQFTEWYYSRICKIDSIRNRNVYFKYPELNVLKGDFYNINYDYWHGRMPRFRLFISDDRYLLNCSENSSINVGKAGIFCVFSNVQLKSVIFEDLYFYGNQYSHSLFEINNSSFSDSLIVDKCFFYGQKGGVVRLSNSFNVNIKNCNFLNQYNTVVFSDRYSENTTISNNVFRRCGLGVNNTYCVICSGKDYLIKDNVFENFGYGAVAVGIWYKFDHPKPSRGIIEGNYIYCTDDYIENINQYGLVDGGAIYLWTINDDVKIRYNFIYNISGAGANRGIYCDDGAKNFNIYGNVILKIHNSNCIDARYAAYLEKVDKLQRSNINKKIMYNIIDGYIIFEGSPTCPNGCVKGENFVINDVGTKKIYKISDIEEVMVDALINIQGMEGLKIVVDEITYKVLKKSPVFKGIKKFIKR